MLDEPQIFKVQKPLNDEKEKLLIYNESQSINVLQTQIPEFTELFKEGEQKIYVQAIYDKFKERFNEIKRVKNAKW